jgi:hypothetical protein
METVAANEKPEEQKMNRRLLAPLALLAIPLLAAGQSAGSIALTDATSEQVHQAYWSKKPGAPMHAGQWEHRIEVVDLAYPGEPSTPELDARIAAAKKDPRVTSLCADGHELSAPEPRAVFEKMGSSCHYDSIAIGNGKLDARLRCKTPDGGGDLLNHVTGTYDADRFAMTMRIEMRYPEPGQGMKMTMALAGRRTGECKR